MLLLLSIFSLFATAHAAPAIVSPTDGSTLSGSSETFTWTDDGVLVDRWRLEVGTVPDGRDIYGRSLDASVTSMLVTGLPTDGSLVYVSLSWRIDGAVSSVSYVYTASDGSSATNTAPIVNAGDDQSIALPANSISLLGEVSDDGLPLDTLNLTWSVLSGPGVVTFQDLSAAGTTATFSTPGDYVLQLNASDTLLETSDQMSVTVHSAAELAAIQVTPDPAVFLVGDTHRFVAAGLDQTGQSYPITPNWDATGGSIDAAGLYVAGTTAGQFGATVTAEGISAGADISLVDNFGPWPTNGWSTALPADVGMDQALLEQARNYALTSGGAGMITRHGQAVLTWGDTTSVFDVNSVTKSIGVLVLGLAIKDNLVNLSDRAQTHYPAIGSNPASNVDTAWLDDITILHLATQTGGFEKPAGYVGMLFQPGTAWAYSDAGVNWLADTLTVVNQGDLLPILESRILAPLGVPAGQVEWTDSVNRDLLVEGFPRREFNSSINISVDAMARLGYLALRNGTWDGQDIIPPEFAAEMRANVPGVLGLPVTNDLDSKYGGAPSHYGIGWWNNLDGALPNVPTDAYWAWGVGDNLILVIPSLDIVVARNGRPWAGNRTPSYYDVLGPFFDPIVASVTVSNNEPPTVNAGLDVTIELPVDLVNLNGTVTDDGLPNGTLDISWSVVSGPGAVLFGDSTLEDTTATFSEAGDYVLRLSATDSLSTSSDDILVSVLSGPDTELPAVALTEPTDGATVSGIIAIAATATDNNSVTEVEFFVAGVSIGADTTAPYSVFWDTTSFADTNYVLTAIGRDPAGNEGAASVTVTLDNATANNQAPVVSAGSDASITLPTDTVGLSGTAVDDGLPSGSLTTTWTAVVAPFAATFVDAGSPVTDVSFGGS
ncbi:MAG TPA: Ig-like domain-containing protein, partial [Woeseiaceae bacterium]|nr:Ig-like domain-containing protein [Woeseiaceae bacterium]